MIWQGSRTFITLSVIFSYGEFQKTLSRVFQQVSSQYTVNVPILNINVLFTMSSPCNGGLQSCDGGMDRLGMWLLLGKTSSILICPSDMFVARYIQTSWYCKSCVENLFGGDITWAAQTFLSPACGICAWRGRYRRRHCAKEEFSVESNNCLAVLPLLATLPCDKLWCIVHLSQLAETQWLVNAQSPN